MTRAPAIPAAGRTRYQQAARTLLRESVLGAMRELLEAQDWASITMADVAATAGVSRQTVYNEFTSRQGLAEAYALALVDEFVAAVDAAVQAHEGRAREALAAGFTGFFLQAGADPLVRSLLTGDVKPDLLRLITTDSASLLDRAAEQLADTFRTSWLQASEADAAVLANGIARQAISYIAMPPNSESDVAQQLADLFAPFMATIVEGR